MSQSNSASVYYTEVWGVDSCCSQQRAGQERSLQGPGLWHRQLPTTLPLFYVGFFSLMKKNVCFWLCYFQCYVTRLHSQIILFGSPEDCVLSNVCHCFLSTFARAFSLPHGCLPLDPLGCCNHGDGSLFDHLCSALEAEEPICIIHP